MGDEKKSCENCRHGRFSEYDPSPSGISLAPGSMTEFDCDKDFPCDDDDEKGERCPEWAEILDGMWWAVDKTQFPYDNEPQPITVYYNRYEKEVQVRQIGNDRNRKFADFVLLRKLETPNFNTEMHNAYLEWEKEHKGRWD